MQWAVNALQVVLRRRSDEGPGDTALRDDLDLSGSSEEHRLSRYQRASRLTC